MMEEFKKGKSPFYPGQPVPVELFVGRHKEIEKMIMQGVVQVTKGKPVSFFVQGEYGIGKSSIASYVKWYAEKNYNLYGIYVSLGGCKTLDDLAKAVLESTVQSGVFDSRRSEKFKNFLAKYIRKQDVFGFSINLEALKQDAPNLSSPFGMLNFLAAVKERLQEDGVQGLMLILDELNGITGNESFACFVKGLIDTNAMQKEPLPLFLILGGVEERRREMIQKHQPVDRLFDIIDIVPMQKEEMQNFFKKAFESVQIKVTPEAMNLFTKYSAGFPKIMHLIGDNAYWFDKDGVIDEEDAGEALVAAASDVGKKYIDQQVIKALRSPDYHSILTKIASLGPACISFKKTDLESGLTEPEKRKFSNFLQRMKKLNVLKSGDFQGEYLVILRMAQLYIWLERGQRKEA